MNLVNRDIHWLLFSFFAVFGFLPVLLLLGLLRLGFINRSGGNKRNLLSVLFRHVHLESLGNLGMGRSTIVPLWYNNVIQHTLIPVSVWFCSRRTQITRVTAHMVAFSM